jgi:hypothetical protein
MIMKTVRETPGDCGAALRAAIDAREDFRVGRKNLTGRKVNPLYGPTTVGSLPEPYKAELFHARPDFVVFSYSTPIAWHDSVTGLWNIPNVRYSVTTSSHQGIVRTALRDQREHIVTGPEISLRTGRGSGVGAFGPGWQD